jgi:hypothetical protein
MGTMHMMEFINKYNLHYGLGKKPLNKNIKINLI